MPIIPPCSPAVRLPVAAMQSASSYTSRTPCLPRFAPSGRPHQRSPHPRRYNEVSSAAMQLLAEASTVFTRFKASKRL